MFFDLSKNFIINFIKEFFWNKEVLFTIYTSFLFYLITVTWPNFKKKKKKNFFIFEIYTNISYQLDYLYKLAKIWKKPDNLIPNNYEIVDFNDKKFTKEEIFNIVKQKIEEGFKNLDEYKEYLPLGYIKMKQDLLSLFKDLLQFMQKPELFQDSIVNPFNNFFIKNSSSIRKLQQIHVLYKNKEYKKFIRKFKRRLLRVDNLPLNLFACYIKTNQQKKVLKFLEKFLKYNKIGVKKTQYLECVKIQMKNMEELKLTKNELDSLSF